MSMTTRTEERYSIADARNNLPRIVHAVEGGSSVELTRRGRPVAVLISASEYARLKAGRVDLWEALQRFRARHDLKRLRAAEVFTGVRDRSPGRSHAW